MYVCNRWWCDGVSDRAWWAIESDFLHSPDKGFWACLGNLPQDLSFTVQFNAENSVAFHEAPLSSGRIVPRITIGRITPFIQNEGPNGKHSIAGYLRLPRPTPVPALKRELHWHRSWAEEPGYATGNPPEDYGQIRGGCSFPWMIAVD